MFFNEFVEAGSQPTFQLILIITYREPSKQPSSTDDKWGFVSRADPLHTLLQRSLYSLPLLTEPSDLTGDRDPQIIPVSRVSSSLQDSLNSADSMLPKSVR